MINWQDYIESNPNTGGGKPIFKGTRITVEFILERLAQGADEKELVSEHIGLKPEHIRAAQGYAAALLRRDELVYST